MSPDPRTTTAPDRTTSPPDARAALDAITHRARGVRALVRTLALAGAGALTTPGLALAAVHDAHPMTRSVPPLLFAHVQSLLGTSLAQLARTSVCFGPIRPSGAEAVTLLYDRRLGALAFVDQHGAATWAPSRAAEFPVRVVGPKPTGAERPTHVTYLFSDRQDETARATTLEYARRIIGPQLMAPGDLGRPSPFDGCTLADVGAYRQQSAATSVVGRVQPAVGAAAGRIAADAASEVEYQVRRDVRDAASRASARIVEGVFGARP